MPEQFRLTDRSLGVAIAVVSLVTLVFALGMERLLDLPPCSLCVNQRWTYVAALLFGAAAAATGGTGVRVLLLGLAGAAFLIGAAIAAFHVGVEHGWWSAIGTCAGDIPELDITQLQERLQNLQEPRCDEVLWRLFGLFSLAEINAVASLGFGVATLTALSRMRR